MMQDRLPLKKWPLFLQKGLCFCFFFEVRLHTLPEKREPKTPRSLKTTRREKKERKHLEKEYLQDQKLL